MSDCVLKTGSFPFSLPLMLRFMGHINVEYIGMFVILGSQVYFHSFGPWTQDAQPV